MRSQTELSCWRKPTMFESGKKLSQHFEPRFNLKHNVKNCSGAKDWKHGILAWWMSSDPSRELGSLARANVILAMGDFPAKLPLAFTVGTLALGESLFPFPGTSSRSIYENLKFRKWKILAVKSQRVQQEATSLNSPPIAKICSKPRLCFI